MQHRGNMRTSVSSDFSNSALLPGVDALEERPQKDGA